MEALHSEPMHAAASHNEPPHSEPRHSAPLHAGPPWMRQADDKTNSAPAATDQPSGVSEYGPHAASNDLEPTARLQARTALLRGAFNCGGY